MIGHSLGAIGALEIAASALAIAHDTVPPTANLHRTRPGLRPRLHADRAQAAHRHRAQRRRRLRRLPERDGAHHPPPGGGRMTAVATEHTGLIEWHGMTAAVTGLGVVAPAASAPGPGGTRRCAAGTRHRAGHPLRRADAQQGSPARSQASSTGPRAGETAAAGTDRVTRLSLAAGTGHCGAGLDRTDCPTYAMGVVTANAMGGFEFGQRELQALWSKGRRHVGALPVLRLVLRRQLRPAVHPARPARAQRRRRQRAGGRPRRRGAGPPPAPRRRTRRCSLWRLRLRPVPGAGPRSSPRAA